MGFGGAVGGWSGFSCLWTLREARVRHSSSNKEVRDVIFELERWSYFSETWRGDLAFFLEET